MACIHTPFDRARRDLFFDEFYDELENDIKGIEGTKKKPEPHLFINKH